jgi:hypothetical protein
MWWGTKNKIQIVVEGGKRVSIDHNETKNTHIEIQVHDVEDVVIKGNTQIPATRRWWQKPFGLLGNIIAGLIVAWLAYKFGWK